MIRFIYKIYIYKYYIYYNLMTTTTITSGSDFIGKTLIIGSTALANGRWSRIIDFWNSANNMNILSTFQTNALTHLLQVKWDGGTSYTDAPGYNSVINVYYIYTYSFVSETQLKFNIYEYNGASSIISKFGLTTLTISNTVLPGLNTFWLGRSKVPQYADFLYNGIYSKVALYNGNLFALDDANILSTLLTVVRSTQTNIINNNTYIFRSLGTNFLGVVVNILNYNATPGSSVTNSNITLIGTTNTSGGYLNIIGIQITIPDAPTNVIASAGNAQATINWTAQSNGGSAIISYSVTSSPGNFQATTVDGSTTTATISGLTNGTSYTFTVVATNALGSSTASAASTPVTTSFIAPSAPTNVTASAGNALAIVTWTASTNNGGSAITSYSVTSSPGNFQATTTNGSTTTVTVSGLTNGTSYTFTVVATNAAGPSAASSASTSIIPSFTVPSAPTNVTALVANAQATINWIAPTNDGGLPITSYRVTSSPGNFQAITANGSTTTATISGLTNGTAYTFIVLATNALGSSPASIATNYENFNNSSKSFRIYCDKLTSNDISNNLIIKSSNKNIEFKVIDEKRIIFKNDVRFNSSMDLNNKPLTGLITISAESLNLSNVFRGSSVNIINRSQFSDISIDDNNKFLTLTNQIQDLSRSFFYNIDVFNNSSVIVDLNVTLYCSYALNERITIELWRDLSMLVQSKDLGSVIASGGIPIPYNITYLDENLTAGSKKYYIKYKLENNVINKEQPQGIINVRTSEKTGYASFMLTEITNNSNYSNKIIFDSSNLTTTSYEIQDLSALFYNTIDVFNSNVQVNINATLFCCYGIKERITIEVWRDLSMIAQNTDLGTINATAGLTIPYSFNYLDTNLSNGPKKYYLKYKLQRDPSSNNTNTSNNLGIINLNTLNSIGTSTILLANVPKINSNLLVNNNNNSFLTTTSELIDLSGLLFNDIEVDIVSSVIVDLNITLFCCYAANERITIQLWRDLSMVFENADIGNSIATTGLTINYKLSLLDQNISPGTVKYYFKYKLETNSSGQPQGILNVNGGYSIIEQANIGVSYNVLSYASMDYDDGYIKNTKIGYNPNIPGDKGSSSGRRDAYFRYIDVAGSDSRFNDSLYVKKNITVDGPTRLTSDLSVNAIPLSAMFDELSNVETYIAEIAIEFSNNRILASDLSASNITISNELYSLNKYYANDLNISGQLLSDVLRVPHEFTLDPFGFFNHSGSFIVNGNLIVNGTRKILHSTILDISAYSIKIATSLRNRTDLSNNPAGFDVSYIAALHYDGTTWNISGGNLLIGNERVGLDISLIDLQTTIFGSLIASKSKYDSSFSLLRTNITNSFNNLYTKSQLDNSYVTFSYAYTDISKLKNYIDLSFVTKQTVSISGSAIVHDYVTKAYVDGSFAILNNKLDLSFALKNSVDLSYSNLRGQITNFFANIDAANAAATNIDISAITIENIKTSKLALTSHVSISGDLIVVGDTSSNSLNISNSYLFSNNGYSSIYSPSSNASTIIEEYYSKFNNYKVFYILADGSLYSLTGRGAISDIRLKENIVDASPKLADLLKVRIVDYNLKANSNKKYIGVVAQELEELFPSLVETENGPNAKTNYKSVKYSCFNVMLIKALQEQQQIITNLTLRLERLRAKKQAKKQVKENA